ncbi:SDR family NAD(P)-dependent oxidoreductase [Nocardia sp. CA-120079]|uniref:SDR family NAD(P)-dependent oxidoreductase n=1 Tax=Nocardia sp. CA-120079 TaxID=3239974 RepID=UPI003D99AD40
MVTVASVLAFNSGALQSAYAATKAGIEALGRSLRVELAPHGVDVTIIYPAYVDARMLDAFRLDEAGRHYEKTIPGFLEGRLTSQSMGKAMTEAMVTAKKTLVFPARWRPVELLRGIWGPLSEAALSRGDDFAQALTLADEEAQR